MKKSNLKLNILPILVMARFILHKFCETNKVIIDEDVLLINISIHKNDDGKFRILTDQT